MQCIIRTAQHVKQEYIRTAADDVAVEAYSRLTDKDSGWKVDSIVHKYALEAENHLVCHDSAADVRSDLARSIVVTMTRLELRERFVSYFCASALLCTTLTY